jgi:hypothetical protein
MCCSPTARSFAPPRVFDSDPHETPPTFALYLDPEWQPVWASDRIDWPDRGLPANWEKAAAQIDGIFTREASD